MKENKLKNETLFTTVTLPGNKKAEIFEAKGVHYLKALSLSKGDLGNLIKSLICQLVKIDNNLVNEETVNAMDVQDISYLTEIISLMLQKPTQF